MKKIIVIVIGLILFSLSGDAQIKFSAQRINDKPTVSLVKDTLFIKPGACKFIKVGDKFYELKTSIQEVYRPPIFGGNIIRPFNTSPTTYYIEDSSENKTKNK